MTATLENTHTQDEAQIRKMIANWSRALERRDLDALLADYAPDAHLFDACPPFQTQGVQNIRKLWENCLPYFPKSFKSEHRDIKLTVGEDVAFLHALHHFTSDEKDHPACQSWIRVTACYRKIAGQWKVIHEHVSFPFDPMTSKVVFIPDPDAPQPTPQACH